MKKQPIRQFMNTISMERRPQVQMRDLLYDTMNEQTHYYITSNLRDRLFNPIYDKMYGQLSESLLIQLKKMGR